MISLRFQQPSQPSNFDTNSKMKAVFLYNFTRYFEWPENKKLNNFIIYVVGKNESLMSELKNLAAKKKVGNQEIEIKNTPQFNSDIISNIIYFSPNIINPIGDAASKNKKQGALIVGETPESCNKGASINFVIIDNKLKFEYNEKAAEKAGLDTKEDFKALALKLIN